MKNNIINAKKNYNRRIDFTKVDKIIKANPTILLNEFRNKCSVKMSAWSFYARKAFLQGRTYKSRVTWKKNVESDQLQSHTCKRKKTLYTILFEKQVNDVTNESRQLLQEFIETLNVKRSMCLEIAEVVFPNHMIEIRAYSS